jgi:hypothetical protein
LFFQRRRYWLEYFVGNLHLNLSFHIISPHYWLHFRFFIVFCPLVPQFFSELLLKVLIIACIGSVACVVEHKLVLLYFKASFQMAEDVVGQEGRLSSSRPQLGQRSKNHAIFEDHFADFGHRAGQKLRRHMRPQHILKFLVVFQLWTIFQ